MPYDLDKYYKKGEVFSAKDYSIRSKRSEQEVNTDFSTWMKEGRIKRSERTTDKINDQGPFFEFF
ncbi:hypothetical protein KIH41_07835 [Litoribacter ruber]|uniref:Uncharacterized protein n=1 Tax=Litoribacter ruber TaxID=702568 RepID=A0AAP2CE53_9BACT|nr:MULTISPECIES: hypothetical protein [Litoribacter]MBS9522658.1 hypothetical protein [Litoribacter alkaliphilus]MBT0811187.1 hypothetical protein [Litoribacter ruber]